MPPGRPSPAAKAATTRPRTKRLESSKQYSVCMTLTDPVALPSTPDPYRWQGRPRTALAYRRVSSDRERKATLQSPKTQRRKIEAWARAHDIDLVGEHEDRNRSGGTLTRDGLDAALERLRRGEAEGLIVARANRASRRALDGLGLIDTLAADGLFIAAVDGTIDMTTPASRHATMNFAQAQREHEEDREQALMTHDRNVFDEKRHMGPTPFGYRRTPKVAEDATDAEKDAASRLVVHDEEAEVVREIFSRRAAGEGWTAIADVLRDRGVRDVHGRTLTPSA